MAHVDQLVYYPVKGCAGTPVRESEVTMAGLLHDRTFMVVDENGACRTQRRQPAMAVIRPALRDEGATLVLAAPGMADLEVEVRREGTRRAVSVFRWDGKGVDQGSAAAAWLADVLGTPARLVRVPPDHQRETPGVSTGTAGFADATALLVTSLSSLDVLNERIASVGGQPVPMNRFRPNVVLTGWPEPHTEDRVRRMTVGGMELGYAKDCVRCTVPTVDQETGHRDGHEPIRTLATYRRAPEGGVTFGIRAAVIRPGPLTTGDQAQIQEWT